FFASYQGDRFKTVGTPTTVEVESPEFRSAVIAASQSPTSPLFNSVSGLLYSQFTPLLAGTNFVSLDGFTGGDYTAYLCPDFTGFYAPKFQSLLGVTATDVANAAAAGCTTSLTPQAGFVNRSAPFRGDSVAIYGSQTGTL